MTRRLAAIAFAALLATAAPAARVPFVGCASDGQQGPQAAPKAGRTPDLAPAAAARLAFYASDQGVGVLAPRGWRCFGMAGSNATMLVVAPGPLDARALGRPLHGPVVRLAYTSGGTSGRFEVAEVAARAFPAAARFVADVEAEELRERYVRGPFPADRRTYRGKYQLLYTTPARRSGLGTRAGLAAEALPIDGVEWLHPQTDMDLTSLAVRLPPDQRPLVAEIIRQATPPPRPR